MKCKHKNTRKLFWSNSNPNRWERTDVSMCLDCGFVVGMQPVEMVQIKKETTLAERTHDALKPQEDGVLLGETTHENRK